MKNYFIHMRHKTFLPFFVFALTGYAASPIKPQTLSENLVVLLLLFLSFGVLLCGGTCALNSAYDRDTEPLNFLDQPPPIPDHLGKFGILLTLLGVGLSFFINSSVGYWAIFAMILSLLYNTPIPFLGLRGKEIGILDGIIDASGRGFVSIFIGYLAAGGPIDERIILIAIAFTLTVFGSYPATQVFQLKVNDTYKTAKNMSSFFGAAKALKVGVAAMLIGFIIILYTIIFMISHDFSDFNSHLSSFLFYSFFIILFLYSCFRQWRWSQCPFENSKKKYLALIICLQSSRIFWIVAEFLR